MAEKRKCLLSGGLLRDKGVRTVSHPPRSPLHARRAANEAFDLLPVAFTAVGPKTSRGRVQSEQEENEAWANERFFSYI